MTWEIALGIFALIAALVPVFNIVVRVNKTLCSLEVVVKQIKECIEDQSAKNGIFFISENAIYTWEDFINKLALAMGVKKPIILNLPPALLKFAGFCYGFIGCGNTFIYLNDRLVYSASKN